MLAIADDAIAVAIVLAELTPRHFAAREHAVAIAIAAAELIAALLQGFRQRHDTITIQVGTAQILDIRTATVTATGVVSAARVSAAIVSAAIISAAGTARTCIVRPPRLPVIRIGSSQRGASLS